MMKKDKPFSANRRHVSFLNPNSLSIFLPILILSFLVSIHLSISPGAWAQDDAADSDEPTADLDITISTQSPENDQPVAGIPFDWEIQIRWSGELDAVNPQIQKSPKLTGLELVKQSTTIRTGVDGERRYAEKVFRYTLKPIAKGQASIGTATIRTGAPDDDSAPFLSTSPATFTIQPAPFSLRDWVVGMWMQTWFRFVLYALIILLFICVTVFIQKRYKNGVPNEPIETADPVEEAFEQARRWRVEGDRSRFIRTLKQAIDISLARRYPEVESSDASAYRECLDVELQMVFDRFYEQSEHIQFAPVSPSPDELDRALDDAKRLTGLKP